MAKIKKNTGNTAIAERPPNQNVPDENVVNNFSQRDNRPYSDKLQDPRWQRKRLEIFSRDNWTCQSCTDTKETLQIHHKKYFPGRDPWEYDNELLLTVCKTCHTVIENTKKTRVDFDFDKIRACCMSDEDGAIAIYRYELNQPIIVVKRGTVMAPTKDAARKFIEILNRGLE